MAEMVVAKAEETEEIVTDVLTNDLMTAEAGEAEMMVVGYMTDGVT
jgi:hypothetical protein